MALSTLPITVPRAVEWLVKQLDDEALATLRATAYDDLIDHHFGLSLVIRNRCRLHENPALVEATGTTTVDDASLPISPPNALPEMPG